MLLVGIIYTRIGDVKVYRVSIFYDDFVNENLAEILYTYSSNVMSLLLGAECCWSHCKKAPLIWKAPG